MLQDVRESLGSLGGFTREPVGYGRGDRPQLAFDRGGQAVVAGADEAVEPPDRVVEPAKYRRRRVASLAVVLE